MLVTLALSSQYVQAVQLLFCPGVQSQFLFRRAFLFMFRRAVPVPVQACEHISGHPSGNNQNYVRDMETKDLQWYRKWLDYYAQGRKSPSISMRNFWSFIKFNWFMNYLNSCTHFSMFTSQHWSDEQWFNLFWFNFVAIHLKIWYILINKK